MGNISEWPVQGMLGRGNGRAAQITPTLHSTQVQTFHGDLLQHMEKNTKLDMQFIKVSLAAPPRPPAHHRQTTSSHLIDGHIEVGAGPPLYAFPAKPPGSCPVF